MAFTGISRPVTVFGTPTDRGITASMATALDVPGGFVLTSIDGSGVLFARFFWITVAGVLRSIDCSPSTGTTVVFDPGTQTVTFTTFDQASSGAAV